MEKNLKGKSIQQKKVIKKKEINKKNIKEKKLAYYLEKIAISVLNFYFYFYLLGSILTILFYLLDAIVIFRTIFSIMFIVYLFELFVGYDRNFLGFTGIIITGLIGYFCFHTTNGVLLGITVGILIINIIKVILNIILNNITKKHNNI